MTIYPTNALSLTHFAAVGQTAQRVQRLTYDRRNGARRWHCLETIMGECT